MHLRRTHTLQGPFSLATVLRLFDRRIAPVEPTSARLSFEVPGAAVEATIQQSEPGATVHVSVEGQTDEAEADEVARSISHIFSLTIDARPFFRLVEEDAATSRALRLCPGLRPLRYGSPFEGLISLMLEQGRNPSQAGQLVANLREVCGVVPPGRPYAPPAFPGKFTLLGVSSDLIEVAGIPRELARRIKDLAATLVGHPDLLEHVARVPDREHAIEHLLALDGLSRPMGYRLLRDSYGWLDLLLISPSLRRGVRRFYELDELPTDAEVKRISQRYAGWRSWWSFLLETAERVAVEAG